ncbi:uncharacterized protein LOC128231392 [Mya arenaria]|uniref:uncharacterized protein LOC128231392 n=1 Tax=Mya arenaria TaxID=6604 RepID=UPI0022E435C7|nr:uncharacterized protein LOC128231392 [Mya arenaria]
MAGKFKNIALDYVTLGLTVLALILQGVAFGDGPWWIHDGKVGRSYFSMTGLQTCQFSCVSKTVLVIEGGLEWILSVRVSEVFGLVFILLALVMAVLAITIRTRPIHTAVVYLHGAAALFILLGLLIFLGCQKQLNADLEGSGSIQYPFVIGFLACAVCAITSVVAGVALRRHLLTFTDDDDDGEFGDIAVIE